MPQDSRTYQEKARYTHLPTDLLYCNGISILDIKVYTAVHFYLGVNESFNKTYDELAHEVESTKGGVYKSLARLIENKYLRKIDSDATKGFVIELATGCGQLQKTLKNVSQQKQKQDKKFPSGNKNVSARKQNGVHSLYTKQVLKKQRGKRKVVCAFNLFDLEKFGFTQRIVANMLTKYHDATERSLKQSLEHFNYIINHTNHGNKIPLAVFRAAIKNKGFVDAPYGFKTQTEIDRLNNGGEDSLGREERLSKESNIEKQKEVRELAALKQWKSKVLDSDMELQCSILESVQEQLYKYSESTALGRLQINHIKQTQYRSYFLDNIYKQVN